MTDELTSLLKAELVALCEEHGLTTDGTKALLIEKLTNHLYPEEEEVVEKLKYRKVILHYQVLTLLICPLRTS